MTDFYRNCLNLMPLLAVIEAMSGALTSVECMRIDDGLGPLVELAASRHNAFHTTEAAEIGVSPRRLSRARQRGLLVSIYPRVWAFRDWPRSPCQGLRAAVLTSGGAAGYLSAAWLHGWVGGAPVKPQVWIPTSNRTRAKPIELHEASGVELSQDVVTVDSIKALNKAATLCLLGAVAPKLLVEKCLDQFLRDESEQWLDATLERLRTATSKGPSLLSEIRNHPMRVPGRTDSWLERVCAKLLAAPSLPPVVLQHEVRADGRNYRIDLACPELKLGIEVHGRSFHFGPGKEDADNVRDLALRAQGWELFYVTYSQLIAPEKFVSQYAAAAAAKAQTLSRPVSHS